MRRLALIDGCAVPAGPAPYIYLVLRKAGQGANSIYRGEDARALLHRHGKSTQAEIHRQFPLISNPPGFSQHELRSDGIGNPRHRRGARIPTWSVGVDSGDDSQHSKDAITAAAHALGWSVKHPYNRGVEAHHWCFARRPRPHGLRQRAQIIRLRRQLRKAAR